MEIKEDIRLYSEIVSAIHIDTKSSKFVEKLSFTLYEEYMPIFLDFLSKDFHSASDVSIIYGAAYEIASIIPEDIRHEAWNIFKLKNSRRGGLWKDVGAVGASIEMHAKLSRLHNRSEGFDRDTAVDLFNYCIIVLMCIKTSHIRVKRKKSVCVITGNKDSFGLGNAIDEVMRINGFFTYNMARSFSGNNTDIVKEFDAYEKECGEKISFLVNNYGINRLSWIGSISEQDFKVSDYNIRVPMMMVNEIVRRNLGPSRIINISSQTHRIAQRTTSIYCASKAALTHITRVMARELAPQGFVVNALAPGKILGTTMTEMTDNQVMELRGWSREEADKYALSLIPAGRFTTTEEMALAAIKILHMPSYINGSVIDASGGQ